MTHPLRKTIIDSIGRKQSPHRKRPYAVLPVGKSFIVRGVENFNNAYSSVSRYMRRQRQLGRLVYWRSQILKPGVLRFTRIR